MEHICIALKEQLDYVCMRFLSGEHEHAHLRSIYRFGLLTL